MSKLGLTEQAPVVIQAVGKPAPRVRLLIQAVDGQGLFVMLAWVRSRLSACWRDR